MRNASCGVKVSVIAVIRAAGVATRVASAAIRAVASAMATRAAGAHAVVMNAAMAPVATHRAASPTAALRATSAARAVLANPVVHVVNALTGASAQRVAQATVRALPTSAAGIGLKVNKIWRQKVHTLPVTCPAR